MQKVLAGMPALVPTRVLFQAVFGPLRMNFAAEPCGPLGSVVVSEAWQSVQVMRLVRVQGALMLLVAPRLLPALARTGWKLPAVSPFCQLVVPVVA